MVDPVRVAGAYGEPLTTVITYELGVRVRSLERACGELRTAIARWGSHQTPMIMLDTNVLINDSAELAQMDWHAITGEDPQSALHVWIALLAVEEIDRLSHRRANIFWRGVETSRRLLCIRALRALQAKFPSPNQPATWSTGAGLRPLGHVVGQLLFDFDAALEPRTDDADGTLLDESLGRVALVADPLHHLRRGRSVPRESCRTSAGRA